MKKKANLTSQATNPNIDSPANATLLETNNEEKCTRL